MVYSVCIMVYSVYYRGSTLMVCMYCAIGSKPDMSAKPPTPVASSKPSHVPKPVEAKVSWKTHTVIIHY